MASVSPAPAVRTEHARRRGRNRYRRAAASSIVSAIGLGASVLTTLITVPILLGIAALSIWLSFEVANQTELSELSSGRTEAYPERLDMIASRSPLTLIFGTGVGSEITTSSVWWWAVMNSHNDFIDITMETGIVGLALTAAMLCLAAAQLDRYQLPLYLSFVISSTVSNGLLSRPFSAALLLCFMAVPAKSKRAREPEK